MDLFLPLKECSKNCLLKLSMAGLTLQNLSELLISSFPLMLRYLKNLSKLFLNIALETACSDVSGVVPNISTVPGAYNSHSKAKLPEKI